METLRGYLRNVSTVMALVMMVTTMWSVPAMAGMVGTGDMIASQQTQVDRQELLSMLERQDVQDKLASMGVSKSEVQKRVQSLTPQELSSFNQQLAQAPAGEGVVGIIVLFLLVFIVTDMLCATNIFSFIHCIR
ncbi:MAG: PA2779 family protein [Marinobacter sp.]|nr:PA2779 family protein [Marinobacter sp.]